MRKFFLAVRAVFAAFAGIRKREHAAPPELRPIHYIAAGIFALLCFITLILTAVNLIV